MKTSGRGQELDSEPHFAPRLHELVAEFGSRYALSKASGIAVSTLQGYEAGSKPGLDALLSLARTGNVSLDWLMTGSGEKRPTGMIPGALLADVVMVDQYQPGTSIEIPMIIGRIPFSRQLLENKLGLQEPTHDTLIAIEATHNLAGIQRGDLVLIDRKQIGLIDDGLYLLKSPGLALREISVFPGEWVLVTAAESERGKKQSAKLSRNSLKMRRSELLGSRGHACKVVARAVFVQRII